MGAGLDQGDWEGAAEIGQREMMSRGWGKEGSGQVLLYLKVELTVIQTGEKSFLKVLTFQAFKSVTPGFSSQLGYIPAV